MSQKPFITYEQLLLNFKEDNLKSHSFMCPGSFTSAWNLLSIFTPLSSARCLAFLRDAAHCRAIDYRAHLLSEWI